ncbi:chromosome segregation protein Spc25-domain-containing protein [Phellopilus nigrolimitatus]|nr:chromosome segregation protein Spc25-domain-containing protein [Phellopilus nigrolimitatus]
MSVVNPRPIDLSAILESQQPVIDLHIKDFEHTTRRFLKAVATYSSRALEEIGQRRVRHAAELKRIAEKKTQVEAEVTACKHKEIELMEVLEREQAERREAESAVSDLKRQLASIKEKCVSVDVELDQRAYYTLYDDRHKRKDMTTLDTNASRVSPELRECEARLQFALEGVERDKLLIRFMQIDPAEPQREFSIVIDTSARVYKVPLTTPPIPTIPLLVDQMNRSRDLFAFIKDVRAQFVEMASVVPGP